MKDGKQLFNGNDEFTLMLAKTREYLDYIEEHNNNVRKAFAEWYRRVGVLQKLRNAGDEELAKRYELVYWTAIDDFTYHVLREMVETHDLSKLSQEEFTPYRRHFFATDHEKKRADKTFEFELALKHHYAENDHHWENRQEKEISKRWWCEILLHNAFDWIGMAYKFKEPIDKYYKTNKHKFNIKEQGLEYLDLVFGFMLDEKLN